MPILTMRGTSLKVKGEDLTKTVQSVMMYGSETWVMKVEDMQVAEVKRTKASMMWQSVASLSKEADLSNKALRGRLGIDCVSNLVRHSRLRWFGLML